MRRHGPPFPDGDGPGARPPATSPEVQLCEELAGQLADGSFRWGYAELLMAADLVRKPRKGSTPALIEALGACLAEIGMKSSAGTRVVPTRPTMIASAVHLHAELHRRAGNSPPELRDAVLDPRNSAARADAMASVARAFRRRDERAAAALAKGTRGLPAPLLRFVGGRPMRM